MIQAMALQTRARPQPASRAKGEVTCRHHDGDGELVTGRVQPLPLGEATMCQLICNRMADRSPPLERICHVQKQADRVLQARYMLLHHWTPA